MKGMYYRRKILLALLESFGGRLTKTDLQKLLFLFVKIQDKPFYDFMPYRFGCYSAQANQDMKTLMKYGFIEESEKGWTLINKDNFSNTLKIEDHKQLSRFAGEFLIFRGNNLVRYVYTEYPFYAIKSQIAEEILTNEEWQAVKKLIPAKNEPVLFTMGYEGKSIENYVTELIKEDVKVLCDIRKNPLSMKYGFSKNQLKGILEAVGIEYISVPGLGIDSDKRQELKTSQDYENLFEEYEKTVLVNNQKDLLMLADIFNIKKRIVLTCFEADYTSCHRSKTANALMRLLGEETRLIHI
jgi:uncharacterized protein (DUF488 family)